MSTPDTRAISRRTTGASALPHGREQGHRVSTRALGAVAVLGAVVWIATVAAFHAIRPDLAPGDNYISNYARGDWAWVIRVAFVINAAGWAAAGVGLRRTLAGNRGANWLEVLAGIAALGMLVAGVFRADLPGTTVHSVEGIIHSRAAGAAFIALILLGFVGWATFRRSDAWAGYALPSLVFGTLALVLFATFTSWPDLVGGGFGWWQRALAAVLIPGWLWAIGAHLRSTDHTSTGNVRTLNWGSGSHPTHERASARAI